MTDLLKEHLKLEYIGRNPARKKVFGGIEVHTLHGVVTRSPGKGKAMDVSTIRFNATRGKHVEVFSVDAPIQ